MPSALLRSSHAQTTLRAKDTVTSQKRHNKVSSHGHRPLLSCFGARRSNRVEPFTAPKDSELSPLKVAATSAESTSGVADQFARVNTTNSECAVKTLSGRNIQKTHDSRGINHRFTLPGAVDDEDDDIIDIVSSSNIPVSSNAGCSDDIGSSSVQEDLVTRQESSRPNDVKTDNSPIPDSEIRMTFSTGGCAWSIEPTDDATVEGTSSTVTAAQNQDNSPRDDSDIGLSRRGHRAEIPYDDEDNLDEEIEFFDRVNEDGDDFLNLDELVDRCPKTDIVKNLRGAASLSRCFTRQLQKALKKWSRISRGPFPRRPGTSHTKAEVIDEMTSGLKRESARYLDNMNKMFFGFFSVTEEVDEMEEGQNDLVESIKARMEE